MAKNERGFHEFMPQDVWKWKLIESKLEELMSLYDYQGIRLAILQDHKVLHDGITALMEDREALKVEEHVLSLSGPDDDISLLSLRPEGTISVLHHTARMIRQGENYRFYYHGPMFRKSQDLMPMEFYQLGVEFLGSESILSENEVICLGMKICRELGLSDVSLEINSFGCKDCQRPFAKALRDYLDSNKGELCTTCYKELYANPMADSTCQRNSCRTCMVSAPKITDYLCDKCKENFIRVKRVQANLAHQYKVNPTLVKNFSYYNETVFDFLVEHNGKPLVIGGGGRYDYLSEKITGKMIPAVGFYLNLDTIFEVMEERQVFSAVTRPFSVYICAQSSDLEIMMLQIATELHQHGITTVLNPDLGETDKDKDEALAKGCSLMIILRDNNIREGKLLLFNLVKQHPQYLPLNQLVDEILISRKALI